MPRVVDVRPSEGASDQSVPAASRDVRSVLAALGAALSEPSMDRDLASVFEQQVRQMIGSANVRLREIPARYQVRLVTPTRTADSIVLGVPSNDPRVQTVLEAALELQRIYERRPQMPVGTDDVRTHRRRIDEFPELLRRTVGREERTNRSKAHERQPEEDSGAPGR